MKDMSAWAAVVCAALIPIVTALIIIYSDVQTLKVTKANTKEVLELKVDFTKQMTRNTTAIENLNETLKELGRRINE